MPRALSLPALAATLCLAAPCAQAQTPAYSVQVVPDPPAPAGYEVLQRDLNAVLPDGRVVVTNLYNGVGGECFIGTEGNWQHFQPLPGDVSAVPSSYSSNGQVVGWSYDADGMGHVVVWNGTVPTALGPQLLHYSGANGINAGGVVSGSTFNQQTALNEAWTWHNGVVTNLAPPAGYSGAEAVQTNNAGLTVGRATSGDLAPIVWNAGVPTTLPVPEGDIFYSIINGINDSGWVVGVREYHEGVDGTYLWRNGVYELIRASHMPTGALISNSGDILLNDSEGSDLWRDGVTYSCQNILTPGFEGSVAWMQTLLDDGRILGKVEVNGEFRNAILTPIPSPASVVLLLTGVLALAKRRRG